jgi:predicted PurR-regulated permease PerM
VNRSDFFRAHWDRTLAAVLLVVGIVVLVIGWLGVSDVPFASQQIPYVISAGIGGVFFLGVAGTLWLSADLQDEWRKLHLLEQAVRELPAQTGDAALDRDELLRALGERLLAGSAPGSRRARS